jgi:4-hydroxy-3-polyprenylbenzoate decarboxylase
VSNLFGTLDRSRFIFRDTLERVQALVELKYDPMRACAAPAALLPVTPTAWRRCRGGSLVARRCARPVPRDRRAAADRELAEGRRPVHHAAAGLHRGRGKPGVMTREPGHVPGPAGRQRLRALMREIGLHYQIHRGIGVHQAKATPRASR